MQSSNQIPSSEILNILATQVEIDTQFIIEQLSTWNGRIVLGFSKEMGVIPRWAENYIELTNQFQNAIYDFKNEFFKDLPENIASIHLESKQALNDLVQKLNPKKYLAITKPKGNFLDKNNLLKINSVEDQNSSIFQSKLSWYQNLGFLRNICGQTQDPDIKKLVGFLALNYLGKAAPICPKDVSIDEKSKNRIYDMFQLSLLEPGISYNRECAMFDTYLNIDINNLLANGSGKQLCLTDTKHFAEILPLWYYVVNTPINAHKDELKNTWTLSISSKLKDHFEKNPTDAYAHYFDPPLLVDLTSLLEQHIYTSGIPENNVAFDEEFSKIESTLEHAINQAIEPFCSNAEDIKTLKAFIIANTTCICRCEVKEVGALKILPILNHQKYLTCGAEICSLVGEKQNSPENLSNVLLDIKSLKSKANFEDFLNGTGIRLGSVKGRMKIFDFLTLDQFLEKSKGNKVEFVGKGTNNIYFNKPGALTLSNLFTSLEKLFDPNDVTSLVKTKPYLEVLGKPTLALLKGLLSEISEEKWAECNNHSEKREIIQTTLFQINMHLTEVDKHKHDFSKFCQSIEFIHYEMATLLTIFTPFNENDFPFIYKKCLSNVIPNELKDFAKAGLTKSAMNTFAGMSAALKQNSECPVRAFDPGSHFEIVQFVGDNYNLENVLNNEKIQKVDLYLGEFNHNVKLLSTHSEYNPGNIISEVETLLNAKPLTEHLTVAVDSTIDFINSPKAKILLEHFSKHIISGKLNFVFFRSGQKFEMFGMDNYYGSPWCMINNGEHQWDSFNILSTHEAFKTDFLTTQWFCLANKYVPESLDKYRKAIFDNTKTILKSVPKILLPGGNKIIKICNVNEGMEPGFLDIKCYGAHSARTIRKLQRSIYRLFTENNSKIHSRGGYGYFNPNVNLFNGGLERDFNIQYSTMRLHPGINTEENEIIIRFLNEAAEIVNHKQKIGKENT